MFALQEICTNCKGHNLLQHEEIFCYFIIYTTVKCSAGKKFHYLTASNLIVKRWYLLRDFNKHVYGLHYSPSLLCNKSSYYILMLNHLFYCLAGISSRL